MSLFSNLLIMVMVRSFCRNEPQSSDILSVLPRLRSPSSATRVQSHYCRAGRILPPTRKRGWRPLEAASLARAECAPDSRLLVPAVPDLVSKTLLRPCLVAALVVLGHPLHSLFAYREKRIHDRIVARRIRIAALSAGPCTTTVTKFPHNTFWFVFQVCADLSAVPPSTPVTLLRAGLAFTDSTVEPVVFCRRLAVRIQEHVRVPAHRYRCGHLRRRHLEFQESCCSATFCCCSASEMWSASLD
jgi:hypothetical protein